MEVNENQVGLDYWIVNKMCSLESGHAYFKRA